VFHRTPAATPTFDHLTYEIEPAKALPSLIFIKVMIFPHDSSQQLNAHV
jgi:hypothetical protein